MQTESAIHEPQAQFMRVSAIHARRAIHESISFQLMPEGQFTKGISRKRQLSIYPTIIHKENYYGSQTFAVCQLRRCRC